MGNCIKRPIDKKKSLKEFSAQTGFFDSLNDLTDHFKVLNSNRESINPFKPTKKTELSKCDYKNNQAWRNDAYHNNKVRRFSYPHRNSATPPSREINSRSSLQRIDAKGDRMGVKVPGKANQQHVLLSEYCPMKSFGEITKTPRDNDEIEEFLQAEIACNLESLPGDPNNLFGYGTKTKFRDKKCSHLITDHDNRASKHSEEHQNYKKLSNTSLDHIGEENLDEDKLSTRCIDLSLKPGSMQRPPQSKLNKRQTKSVNYSQNNLEKKSQPKKSTSPSSQDHNISSETFQTSKIKQPRITAENIHNRRKETKTPEVEAEEEEHPVEYTFYVEDKDECRKPFVDRRVPSIASGCRCKVFYHDRDSSDRRIYYKGNPVRPVTITAPSIGVLRRCLGKIDSQFPHFNARAFLSNTLTC